MPARALHAVYVTLGFAFFLVSLALVLGGAYVLFDHGAGLVDWAHAPFVAWTCMVPGAMGLAVCAIGMGTPWSRIARPAVETVSRAREPVLRRETA